MRALPRRSTSAINRENSPMWRRYLCEWTNDVTKGAVSGSTVAAADMPLDSPSLLYMLAAVRMERLKRLARNQGPLVF
jgi:hypothetical protein